MKQISYYSKDSIKEHEDYVLYSDFFCIECGYRSLKFKSKECDAPGCHANADLSRKIGIIILEELDNYYGENYNVSLDEIFKNKLVSIIQKECKGIKRSKGIKNYNKECFYDEIIDFYCEQYRIHKNLTRKVTYLLVEKLFGYHSYKISFDEKNMVSIVYGTNGLGKTTILKLLKSVLIKNDLVEQLDYLFNMPFEKFEIGLECRKPITIIKSSNKNKNDIKTLKFEYNFDGFVDDQFLDPKNGKDFILSNDSREEKNRLFHTHFDRIDKILPKLNGESKFLFINTNRTFNYDNLFSFFVKEKNHGSPIPFSELIDFADIKRAYENNDILGFYNYIKKQSLFTRDFNLMFNAVKKSLVGSYEEIEYDGEVAYLDEDDKHKYDILAKSEFLKELCGTFDVRLSSEKNKTSNKYFLSFSDSVNEAYDFMLKCDLYKEYYESFFDDSDPSKKEVCLKDNTLAVRNSNNVVLSFADLSSGEINIATLLFNIIFKVDNGSVLLIDEPEISLHIEWQSKIVDMILELNESKNCQVIITTHSPFLSGGHEEMMVGAYLL